MCVAERVCGREKDKQRDILTEIPTPSSYCFCLFIYLIIYSLDFTLVVIVSMCTALIGIAMIDSVLLEDWLLLCHQ